MLTFLLRWDSVTRLSTLFASYRPHMNSRKRFCDFFFDFAKIFYVVTTTGAGIFSLGSLGKGFFIFLNGWYWVWQKFNISRTALILGLSLHCADIKYFPGQRWYLVYRCKAQIFIWQLWNFVHRWYCWLLLEVPNICPEIQHERDTPTAQTCSLGLVRFRCKKSSSFFSL